MLLADKPQQAALSGMASASENFFTQGHALQAIGHIRWLMEEGEGQAKSQITVTDRFGLTFCLLLVEAVIRTR